MTLPASQANQFTNDSITLISDRKVGDEIQTAEGQVRNMAGSGRFTLSYNARIIGNPAGDPQTTTLSDDQQLFLDHFTDLGYFVGIDPRNGNWFLDWATVGVEVLTSVYSVRTTVAPGAVSAQTIVAIDTFFAGLIPAVTSRTVLVDKDPTVGGDIPESDFGAPDSVFYEYWAVVTQQDSQNHSTDLKTALRASGLGYVDDTRITGVGGATNTTSSTNTIDIGNGVTTVTITVGGTGTAVDLVAAINANATLLAINIVGDINGPDVLIKNTIGGTLIATNNVGDVLGDIFSLASPQSGVVTDNTETYKFA